jgi:uncharacterized protein YndB with AHSA1/START domain
MSNNKLKISPAGECEITMTRTFNAPKAMVYDALTKPELVKRWLLGPPGWTMPICEIDLRIGEGYRYVWRHQDGREMGVSGIYKDLNRPHHLIHTEKFDTAWYPGESLITTVLKEKDGKTEMVATMLYESREARDQVLRSDMEKGVAPSYDKLEALLKLSA